MPPPSKTWSQISCNFWPPYQAVRNPVCPCPPSAGGGQGPPGPEGPPGPAPPGGTVGQVLTRVAGTQFMNWENVPEPLPPFVWTATDPNELLITLVSAPAQQAPYLTFLNNAQVSLLSINSNGQVQFGNTNPPSLAPTAGGIQYVTNGTLRYMPATSTDPHIQIDGNTLIAQTGELRWMSGASGSPTVPDTFLRRSVAGTSYWGCVTVGNTDGRPALQMGSIAGDAAGICIDGVNNPMTQFMVRGSPDGNTTSLNGGTGVFITVAGSATGRMIFSSTQTNMQRVLQVNRGTPAGTGQSFFVQTADANSPGNAFAVWNNGPIVVGRDFASVMFGPSASPATQLADIGPAIQLGECRIPPVAGNTNSDAACIYVQNGALMFRGSNGTITTLAPA